MKVLGSGQKIRWRGSGRVGVGGNCGRPSTSSGQGGRGGCGRCRMTRPGFHLMRQAIVFQVE